jgi:hypothetical protein
MFNGGFKEAKEFKADFPDDSVTSFDVLVAWVYTGQIREYSVLPDKSTSFDIRQFYKLTDKLCLFGLADKVMDILRSHQTRNTELESYNQCQANYQSTALGSPLRRFSLDSMLYSFLKVRNLKLWSSEELKRLTDQDEDLRHDFLEALYAVAAGDVEDPRKKDNCAYHHHSRDEPCSAKGMEGTV